tara:strand:- start:2305 stop:6294 length:3990 start_codon:yes stop_codon:yes gene_type:complete
MATQIRVTTQDGSSIVYLDLSEAQPLTANFQFKDIQDFKSTKGNHTFNFRVPSTPKNNLFFKDYFDVNQFGNYNPKVKVEATITQETLEVFNGFLQLTNVVLTENVLSEYECVVFSSVSSLGQVLSGKYISEFDWSSYVFPLTTQNVINSINGTLFGGDMIYSLYDYGSCFYGGTQDGSISVTPVNITSLKPQLKVSTVFRKILNESGFTYESTFLDTTMDNLFMDLNAGGRYVATAMNQDFFNVYATQVGTTTFTASNGVMHTIKMQVGANVQDTNTSGNYNPTTGQYNPQNTWVATQGVCFLKLTSSGQTSTNTIYFLHLWNVTDDESTGIVTQGNWSNTEVINTIEVDFGATPLDHTKSYEYRIVVSASDPSATPPTWTIQPDSFLKFEPLNAGLWSPNGTIYTQADNDASFDTSRNLPKIKALDFVTSLAKKFNLVIIPDELQPSHLYIEPYSIWIEQGSQLDWTDKLDTSKSIQYKPTANLQAKSLLFTDAESEDYMNALYKVSAKRIYGEQFVDNTSNDFGKAKEEIKTIFIPTISMYIQNINGGGNTEWMSCICHDGEGETPEGIRLSFFNGTSVDITQAIKITDNGGTTFQSLTANPVFSNYKDLLITEATEVLTFAGENTGGLNYPTPLNGAYNVYWQRFLEETYSRDARLMIADFNLSSLDIQQFQFNDIVFVKNEYFRINKISNYPLMGEGVCKVELVKTQRVNVITQDVAGDDFECVIEPSTINASGQVNFINTSSGLPVSPSQICCEAFGYTYIDSACYQLMPGPNNPTIPIPHPDAGSWTIKGGNNGFGGKFVNVMGNNNSTTSFTSIVGSGNLIDTNSISNNIYGSQNTIKNNVTNSHINGAHNVIDTYQFNHDGYIGATQVQMDTIKSFKNNQLLGDYGVALGSGEVFISGGEDKLYNEVGRSGFGQFVVNAFTDNKELIDIGQNGRYNETQLGGYTNASAIEGFRLQYPSIASFEVTIVGQERGSQSNRSQNFSLRKYGGLISNTNNGLTPRILNTTLDVQKETTIFAPYIFNLSAILGQRFNDGDIINDGSFKFQISTNGTSLGLVDWTIDFQYTLVGVQNLSRNNFIPAFRPPNISGCLLWLDASDYSTFTFATGSTSNIEIWDDLSGNNHHVQNSYANEYPQYGVESTIPIPYVSFDGIRQQMRNSATALQDISNNDNTVFVVFEADETTAKSNGELICGTAQFTTQKNGININATNYGGGGADSVAFKNGGNDFSCNVNTIPVTQRQAVVGQRNGTQNLIIDQENNQDTNSLATTSSTNFYCLGGCEFRGFIGQPYSGKIYEVIAYNTDLSDAEINQVMNYLKSKWNT